MPAPDSISPGKLAKLIGTPRCPTLLDVRNDADFSADPRLLPGAVRLSADGVPAVSSSFEGQSVVVACHAGHRLSQGVAAWLRQDGIAAEYLEGGYEAWTQGGHPTIDSAKLPQRGHRERTVWVTRSRPKVDRIACAWLIRRFLDPGAVFLFVAPADVSGVGDYFAATPFDMEEVFWSHRGELCTFDVMIREFGLRLPALEHLARIVRGADTARLDLEPECAGLLAVSLGLSRMYSDDLQQLDAGLALYDAFYRWARDATDESHDWPACRNSS